MLLLYFLTTFLLLSGSQSHINSFIIRKTYFLSLASQLGCILLSYLIIFIVEGILGNVIRLFSNHKGRNETISIILLILSFYSLIRVIIEENSDAKHVLNNSSISIRRTNKVVPLQSEQMSMSIYSIDETVEFDYEDEEEEAKEEEEKRKEEEEGKGKEEEEEMINRMKMNLNVKSDLNLKMTSISTSEINLKNKSKALINDNKKEEVDEKEGNNIKINKKYYKLKTYDSDIIVITPKKEEKQEKSTKNQKEKQNPSTSINNNIWKENNDFSSKNKEFIKNLIDPYLNQGHTKDKKDIIYELFFVQIYIIMKSETFSINIIYFILFSTIFSDEIYIISSLIQIFLFYLLSFGSNGYFEEYINYKIRNFLLSFMLLLSGCYYYYLSRR